MRNRGRFCAVGNRALLAQGALATRARSDSSRTTSEEAGKLTGQPSGNR